VLSRKPNRRGNIGRSRAARDQRRAMVDHPVEESARFVVTAVAGPQQRAAQTVGKVPHRILAEGRLAAVGGDHAQFGHG
jgi:hypothetical protein